jgi:SAM-dependent methyltransferase
MSRWARAERLVAGTSGRLLDLGCAFGFGTRRLAQRFETVGADVSEAYIRRAVRADQRARYCLASGERLPFSDASFDAVAALDVLEHVAEQRETLSEIARVLRPGGALVLSVPHRGLLARFDSYNVCANLLDHETVSHSEPAGCAPHRHYSVEQLRTLLGNAFEVDVIQLTGLGLAEFVNIGLVWLCLRALRWPRLYDWLQYIYFSADLAEDFIPLGRSSYHLMLRARRLPAGTEPRCSAPAARPAAREGADGS